MPDHNTPVFLRLPKGQARALEQLSRTTGLPKQKVVSQLLAERLSPGPLQVGRVEIAPPPSPADEVLTLTEAAKLLKVSEATLEDAAEAGAVPARRLGADWRFSRAALLSWLAQTGGGERT